MRRYIIQRVIWIFIILFTTLTITYVLLKLAPEYPPSKNEEKDTWLEKQVEDGYYTSRYLDMHNPDDMAYLEEVKLRSDFNKKVFIVNPIGNVSTTYKVFYRIPIAVQYFRWVENVLTKWNWGTSTKI